ncbi:MAG: hypothetical protein R3B49_07545 [Phycisphaerales bacterium]
MNVELLDLWLPIVLSAVIAFVASFVMWMVLPIHKPDIKALPDEGKFNGAIAPLGLKPGLYMFPNCQGGENMKSEGFQERWRAGPWGTINVLGTAPNFIRNLAINLIEMLAISFVVAYLSTMALHRGDEYMHVFRFIGASAIGCYVLGHYAGGAFMGTPLRFQITNTIDGVIYALLTAGTFAWLWPAIEGGALPIPTP